MDTTEIQKDMGDKRVMDLKNIQKVIKEAELNGGRIKKPKQRNPYARTCNTPYSQGSVVCINPEHLAVSPQWVNRMNSFCPRTREDDNGCPCQEYNAHGVKCLLTKYLPMYVLQSKEGKATLYRILRSKGV